MTRRSKRRIRSFTAVLATAVGLIAGCTPHRATLQAPAHPVGDAMFRVASDPDPARVGDNVLMVQADDATGRPLRGAVEVSASMAAMGAMPGMNVRARVAPAGPGMFRASYALPMAGEWELRVRLEPPARAPLEARYRVSTMMRGLAFVDGTPSAAGGAEPAAGAASSIADTAAGAITIDAARRQSYGIRTETVALQPIGATLRLPGRVEFDATRRRAVAMRFDGWIRELSASAIGQPVRRGEVLCTVYSPELWAAQQAYLEAARAARSDRGDSVLVASSTELRDAARRRLALWGLAESDIDAMARSGHPFEAFPVRATTSGVVTDKSVVAGSAFTAGQTLFGISPTDPVWVIANVPQPDAPAVRPGAVAILHDPAGDRSARVAFVAPSLDSTSRTLEARIQVPNGDGGLRPGAFFDVELRTAPRRALAVPESAVLPSGDRNVVFVDLGGGRLAPREVALGERAGGYYEVRSGLRAGDRVVTSGNFLVAAESKLRSAEQKW